MITCKPFTQLQTLRRLLSIKIWYCMVWLAFQATAAQAQNHGYQATSSIDSVFTQLKHQLNHAETNNNTSVIVQSHISLADFYNHLGIQDEAIKHYHQALDLHTNKDTTLVYIGNKISAIHLALKQYKNASQYSKESLETAKLINFEKGKATSYALLGSVAEKETNYKLALQYQEQSLAIFKSLKDSIGLAYTYENLGSIYEDLEDYNNALLYFKTATDYAKHSPSDTKINIINNLGDAYRKMGQLNNALQFTQQALQMAKATNNIDQEESALKDLALIYAGMGDYQTAFNHMTTHAKLNADEIEQKNADLVSSLQILYEVAERDAQVKLLNKQNEVNRIRQNIILLSCIFLILILVGWLVYFKKRKKQESKIKDYKHQLLQANLDKKTQEEAALKREVDIKMSALTNYSLHLAHKNKMIADISRTLTHLKDRNTVMIKSKLETVIKDINSDLSQEEEWTEFIGFFEQIHPNFFHSIKHDVTTELSASELRLCMLLRLNLSSKEIASILRITPDSVRIARYRLRKKLPIDSKDDLQTFILNL